jgi:antitoxin MazE
MTTRLIQIGDSHAILIPRRIVTQIGLMGELEVCTEGTSLVIRRARKTRQGWADSFARMARLGDDVLLDGAVALSGWDEIEWQW